MVRTSDDSKAENKPKNEWKEVQLRISENGEMCFTGIDDSIILNEQITKYNSKADPTLTNKDVKDTVDKTNAQVETKTVNELNLLSSVNTTTNKQEVNQKKEIPPLKYIGRELTTTTTSIQSTIAPTKVTNNSAENLTKNVTTTSSCETLNSVSVKHNNLSKTTTTAPSEVANKDVTKLSYSNVSSITNTGLDRTPGEKYKIQNDVKGEPPSKQPKPTILNSSLGIQNLSNNHPLKRHSQIRRSIEGTGSIDTKSPVNSTTSITTESTSTIITIVPSSSTSTKTTTTTVLNNTTTSHNWPSNKTTTNVPCYTPKTTYNPVINVPKVQASTSASKADQRFVPPSPVPITQSSSVVNNKTKSKSNAPIGYKTLRDPPKTWNPQISRASLLKSPDPKYGESKNVKPAKFFKMRNNMPRYLGNPASGVKPLYQVHNSPEKDKDQNSSNKSEKTEIKKHSIVKVDPKTLKPISEKAPDVSNLSNQTDLKINTSSVPIFNPLKLQSSPKNDRKSPKSPQSPKPKSSSPPSKRDKVNLNYTPPNPFIPNLTSSTLSPNQFLYPAGPPGFPTYDPRIMAAYHSLLYGQRMPYPPSPLPGLTLDLNQRKTFDLPAPTSPKVPTLSQYSPKAQISLKPNISETNTKPSNSEPSSPKQLNNTSIQEQKNLKNNTLKRSNKESNKNEKSLENTVEKLTQNRVKELTKSEEATKTDNVISDKAAQESQEKKQELKTVQTENGDRVLDGKENATGQNVNAKIDKGKSLEDTKEENKKETKGKQECSESKQISQENDLSNKTEIQAKEKGDNKNVSINNNTNSLSLITDTNK